mgnify:CR=1 FL=1
MPDDDRRDMGLENDEKSRRVSIRAVIAGIVAIGAVIFIFQNQDDTRMEFLFFSGTVPLYLVIIISMVLGAVLGWFVGYMRRRRRRRADRISSEGG